MNKIIFAFLVALSLGTLHASSEKISGEKTISQALGFNRMDISNIEIGRVEDAKNGQKLPLAFKLHYGNQTIDLAAEIISTQGNLDISVQVPPGSARTFEKDAGLMRSTGEIILKSAATAPLKSYLQKHSEVAEILNSHQ